MGMRLRSEVSTADSEYGMVLLDERSGEYWTLNPVGVTVVRTLLAGGTAAHAVTALTDEFDVDASQATRDVSTLLEQLHSAGLVAP